jgi:hypothetical protein
MTHQDWQCPSKRRLRDARWRQYWGGLTWLACSGTTLPLAEDEGLTDAQARSCASARAGKETGQLSVVNTREGGFDRTTKCP